jgi:hypothetical protein
MRHDLVSRRFYLVLAILVLPSVAHAQRPIEAGIARDAKTKAPLQCLHVALLDSTNRPVAHTVTDEAGQFSLEAPGPGAFRLRFEIYAWETLAGPLDTLASGDFKQRAYPLTFANMLSPSATLPGGIASREPTARSSEDREAWIKFEKHLRRDEADSVWVSRHAVPGMPLRYPPTLWGRIQAGGATAQFVVDSSGRVREESWVVVHRTRDEFATAVRKASLVSEWKPARLYGRPTCELVRLNARFYADSDKQIASMYISP